MTKIFFSILSICMLSNLQAQKINNTKWYEFYLGGKKGFFTKTHTITDKKITENQTGSGGEFDNKPSDVIIEKFITTDADERIINKYDENTYMVIVFKNITADKAKVCLNTEQFKTIEEAKAFMPEEEDYATWYTEAGFTIENAKPIMPTMTKNDMIDLSKFMVEKLTETSKKLDEKKLEPDDKKFALVMSIVVVPLLYAENKGFHSYKSLSVFEKGITKFKNDAAVKKVFKDAGFGDILIDK
jgi:hypothetical protein